MKESILQKKYGGRISIIDKLLDFGSEKKGRLKVKECRSYELTQESQKLEMKDRWNIQVREIG